MPTGTITALQTQVHDHDRVNLFVDDVFAIGISLQTVIREDLYVGKTIESADWERLESVEYVNKAYQAVLRLLSMRPRSIAEVRTYLERKQVTAATADIVVERLVELDLLDDVAFARLWVENRQAFRPRGAHVLRHELHRKGITRAIIDATLDDPELIEDASEQATRLAHNVLPRYATISDRTIFFRRLGGYLQRRGFGYDVIQPIMESLWQECHE